MRSVFIWLFGVAGLLLGSAAGAQDWKYTFSRYHDSVDGQAYDLNLRGTLKRTTFWVGTYGDSLGLRQSRAGLDHALEFSFGRLVPSGQIASGGFAGWFLTWDGRSGSTSGFSPLLGLGRTNTRPYVNLNFDPNDSVLLGGSYLSPGWGLFTGYRIRDNRLGTGQTVDHLIWRRSFDGGYRLTLDLFARSGAVMMGEPSFRGRGFSLTADIRDWFVRVSLDPHANYTAATVNRLSVGGRF